MTDTLNSQMITIFFMVFGEVLNVNSYLSLQKTIKLIYFHSQDHILTFFFKLFLNIK